jgi:hypothetical protein
MRRGGQRPTDYAEIDMRRIMVRWGLLAAICFQMGSCSLTGATTGGGLLTGLGGFGGQGPATPAAIQPFTQTTLGPNYGSFSGGGP